jgi:hypothetical protein
MRGPIGNEVVIGFVILTVTPACSLAIMERRLLGPDPSVERGC